jgi:hypothetical protein
MVSEVITNNRAPVFEPPASADTSYIQLHVGRFRGDITAGRINGAEDVARHAAFLAMKLEQPLHLLMRTEAEQLPKALPAVREFAAHLETGFNTLSEYGDRIVWGGPIGALTKQTFGDLCCSIRELNAKALAAEAKCGPEEIAALRESAAEALFFARALQRQRGRRLEHPARTPDQMRRELFGNVFTWQDISERIHSGAVYSETHSKNEGDAKSISRGLYLANYLARQLTEQLEGGSPKKLSERLWHAAEVVRDISDKLPWLQRERGLSPFREALDGFEHALLRASARLSEMGEERGAELRGALSGRGGLEEHLRAVQRLRTQLSGQDLMFMCAAAEPPVWQDCSGPSVARRHPLGGRSGHRTAAARENYPLGRNPISFGGWERDR